MSGYPTGSGGYPYGGPPSSQPYGAPPAAPYGAPPGAPYGGYGSPSPAPYGGASQYGGAAPYQPSGSEKPSKAQQGNPYNPSAPPPSDPYSTYGAPYAQPGGEKPSKTQQGYSPSAPPPSDPYGSYGAPYGGEKPSKMQQGGGYQPSAPPPPQGQYGANPYGPSPFAALVPSAFPPGTDPNVVASFQVADQDGSGFIDDKELQGALSSYNQKFSLRTVHLLMYLFTSSNVRKIGPKEFISVFYSLQSWRAIFERFDRDRSGQIDSSELRDALLSLGFSVSPVVLDLLVSKFDKTGGKNKTIEYDNFIECCLTVKGLTEKFKEKDVGYTGSATFNYESFMLTVLPFLIA